MLAVGITSTNCLPVSETFVQVKRYSIVRCKEYDKFKERTKNELSPVEIHFLENFEREQKRLLDGKDNGDSEER